MRKIYAVGAFLFLASAAASAEMWAGQLFDANCAEKHRENQKYEECTPHERTASFVLQVSGRIMKLDANGDKKAAAAWRDYMNSADRSVDPDGKAHALTAVVQGTLDGDQIKVDAILLR